MGQPGDLLLVFADALVRSWKQIIKFRPEGMAAAPERPKSVDVPLPTTPVGELAFVGMEGMVRDERGIRFARESED
jgi:cyanophycin synthetase